MEHKHFVWIWLIVMFWATAALVATEFWRVDKGQEALWFAVFFGWALIALEFQQLRKREKEEEKEWEKQKREMYDKQQQYEERPRKRRKGTKGNN